MLVGILMLAAGGVLLYAGVTGLSVQRLFLGDNTTPSTSAQGTVVKPTKVGQ